MLCNLKKTPNTDLYFLQKHINKTENLRSTVIHTIHIFKNNQYKNEFIKCMYDSYNWYNIILFYVIRSILKLTIYE